MRPRGEASGSLAVQGGGRLLGGEIAGEITAATIDELPLLAVLGAVSREGLGIRDAAELRVKESDRIAATAENLRRMGVRGDDLRRRHGHCGATAGCGAPRWTRSATTASPWPSRLPRSPPKGAVAHG